MEDGVPARAAALSYYVVLSLGPLLALLVGALQLLASEGAQRQPIVDTIQRFFGPRAAGVVDTAMAGTTAPDFLSPVSLITVAARLWGATAAFSNIRGF